MSDINLDALVGRTIDSVETAADETRITLKFTDGGHVNFQGGHQGNLWADTIAEDRSATRWRRGKDIRRWGWYLPAASPTDVSLVPDKRVVGVAEVGHANETPYWRIEGTGELLADNEDFFYGPIIVPWDG